MSSINHARCYPKYCMSIALFVCVCSVQLLSKASLLACCVKSGYTTAKVPFVLPLRLMAILYIFLSCPPSFPLYLVMDSSGASSLSIFFEATLFTQGFFGSCRLLFSALHKINHV